MIPDKLPVHWVEARLRDIVHKLVDGSHNPPPKQQNGLPMLSAVNIGGNTINFNETHRLISEKAFAQEDQRTSIAQGDVLLTIVGAIGRAAVVPRTSHRFTVQRSVAVLGPTLVDPKFLMHQLEAPGLARYLKENARGTAQKGVYLRTLGQAPIWIAPLHEQRRIVAKMEELFSELDKGVETLTIAREQLKAYRQSVLKHAFEGKLTGESRKLNGDRFDSSAELLGQVARASDDYYARELLAWGAELEEWTSAGENGKKPAKPDRPADAVPVSDEEAADLPSLPPTWTYARLSTLAQIGSGMSVSKDRAIADPIEVPYLRVANVQRGKLDLSHMARIKIERTQLRALALKAWDVLFNEGGDRDKLGRGWIWEGQIDPCITQNHVFRASPYLASESHAKFISYWGNTFGQNYFNTEGKQTTNLASINKAVLSAFPIPLPPLEEQAEIVNEIEYRLSLADGLQHEIDAALKRNSSLRQSILAKAFSGQLVAQDPNDEPASALLERIKAEKGPSKGQKMNGRRKKDDREAA